MNGDRFLRDLRRLFQVVVKPLGEILSSALHRKTQVLLSEIRPVDQEELQADFPGQSVLTRATLETKEVSEFYYLLHTRRAAAWANLVAKAEGEAEFSAEEHLPAMSTLLNQLSSALGDAFSSLAGFSTQATSQACELHDITEKAQTLESYFRVDLTVKSEEQKPALLTLLFSPEAFQTLSKIPILEKRASVDRPPPAILGNDMDRNEEPEVRPARFEDFGSSAEGASGTPQNIDMLMDLELPVIIELGRTSMFIRDILDLGPGSIVELNKLSGEPVDLYVNDKKFALGEVVVIDENFGIRITDLVKVEDRIRSLK